jgi:pseudoazurin
MRTLQLAAVIFTLAAGPALAANHEVHMLNKGADGAMVFEPALTNVAVGDTVTFIPTDKGHNAETISDILPAGAAPFRGAMGEQITVTFDLPGAYGIKCSPHVGMGMVALVVVGDAQLDKDAILSVKLPKKAHERLEGAIGQLP